MSKAQGIAQSANQGQFKNRIINGDCRIDQRNNGASVTMNGGYTLDRWDTEVSQSSKLSIQQQTSVVPTGFTYAMALTSLSSYSVGSSETFNIKTIIEGFNCADLGWGTASASTVTLSFWVRSSLTGTFGGALQNGDNNRAYPFSYTILAANTWEQKTVTVAGDTTGTWGKTNGRGIQIRFSLGAGSTFSGTANAWAAGDIRTVTGATSVVGTNGATFYITGVMLEKGSIATNYDVRPYGTELALCQRYCEANAGYMGAYISYKMGGPVFVVTKRAVPTIKFYSGDNLTGTLGSIVENNATGNPYAVTSYSATASSIDFIATAYGTTTNMGFSFLAECEL
jgi:hypothetical protein